jgi:FHA domain
MPTCPKGHTSTAADYCDECGAPIGAAPTPTPSAAPSTVEAEETGAPCPECATPRAGRFCEVCGHDFLAEPSSEPASPAAREAAPTPEARPEAIAKSWRVVVTADREFHARMHADPDAEAVPFPAYCPERRFDLTGAEMLIGRRSRSRGIEPAIDLTGPPEDAGASHMHALLVATPEGTWTIVDLGSANGTYLNEDTDPIAPNQPVPLANGDRVHVGAWTTLTLVECS